MEIKSKAFDDLNKNGDVISLANTLHQLLWGNLSFLSIFAKQIVAFVQPRSFLTFFFCRPGDPIFAIEWNTFHYFFFERSFDLQLLRILCGSLKSEFLFKESKDDTQKARDYEITNILNL